MKKYVSLIFAGLMLAACVTSDPHEDCKDLLDGAQHSVFFDKGGFIVSDENMKVLDSATEFLSTHRFRKVHLDGYSDELGGEQYAQHLSELRANAVRKYLVQHNVPAKNITVSAHGKQPGTPYEQYRRVDISIETD